MDRSWIKSRMFSKEHMDGVNEFMTFISERFSDDEEILCPCRRCLNRVHNPKGLVEEHLYIHGMATTYTRWVHHGEPLEVVAQENVDHVDEHTSLNEDFGMKINAKSAAMNDRVHDLESKLEAEKLGSAGMRSQVVDLQKELEEQKEAARKNDEETEKLKQQGSEIQGFLRSLFGNKFASGDAQQ